MVSRCFPVATSQTHTLPSDLFAVAGCLASGDRRTTSIRSRPTDDTLSISRIYSTFLPVESSHTTNESQDAVASSLPSADRSESRIQSLCRKVSLPHQNG